MEDICRERVVINLKLKAQAIMLLARHGSSVTQNKAVSPIQVQTPISRPSAGDGFVGNKIHTASPCSGLPSPIYVTSSSTNELTTVKSAGASASANNQIETSNTVSSVAPGSAILIPAGAVPQARKASLARFLEKRKERLTDQVRYPSLSPKSWIKNLMNVAKCLVVDSVLHKLLKNLFVLERPEFTVGVGLGDMVSDEYAIQRKQEIPRLHDSELMTWPSVTQNQAAPPIQVQTPISRPSAGDGFVGNKIHTASPCSGLPSPISVTSSSTNELTTVKSVGALASANNQIETSKTVSSVAPGSAILISAGAVPQARKASLALFLEKRKERVMNTSPHNVSKKSLDCSATECDDVYLIRSYTTSAILSPSSGLHSLQTLAAIIWYPLALYAILTTKWIIRDVPTIDSNLKYKGVRIPVRMAAKCEFRVEDCNKWSLKCQVNLTLQHSILRGRQRLNPSYWFCGHVTAIHPYDPNILYTGSELSHVKERIDAIDKKKLTYDYSVIGSDPALMNKALDKISFRIEVESCPDGGSIFKRSSKSYATDGAEVNEEEIKAGQEKAMEAFVGISRAFEAYILANPEAYYFI
ncbi:hypothetical protein GH714_024183 [Hevea brasiliensis]|uniref:Bet v I/Major latex protein domain-containing protein n=1 Tax=Hevea brasiliensis TaxID=3981 RepID=A0A6A6MVJ6_HEVBR|nr:hypothetical protein GH714_024183 [Hevea brasiliensis]